MPIPATNAAPHSPYGRYGAASRYDFDNPEKWVTVTGVPVLDEHEQTDEKGQPVGYVDSDVLQEISRNNNNRVLATGDPAPLTVGHTSDNPNVAEKPIVGFAVNYRVAPFKNGRNAIYVDYKIRKRHENVIEDFPRRSVELWMSRKELDPIALLGGTTPERDLGVIIRKARIDKFTLDTRPTTERQRWLASIGQRSDDVLCYNARGGVVYRYSLFGEEDDPMPCPPGGMPQRYAEGEGDEFDDGPPEDDGGLPPDEEGMGDEGIGDEEDGGEDPVVARVLQSKQFKSLEAKVDEILAALTGDEGGGMPPGGGGPGGPPPGGPPPGPGAGMEPGMAPMGGGGGPGMEDPEEEAQMFHGAPPVRFESTGFPGPGSVGVPQFGKKFSRNGGTHMNGTRRPQQQPRRPAAGNDRLSRLERQNQILVQKLSRAEAEKTIDTLKGEGIEFADEKAEVEFLALLDDASRKHHVENVIKKNYKRKPANPANPAYPGAARYARAEVGNQPDADDYTPENAQDAVAFADLQVKKGMTREQAIKHMRSRSQK